MDSLKSSLSKFFETYTSKINIKKLVSMFKIQPENYSILIDTLYELEKEGKIIGDSDGNYTHISKEYYLKEGIIQKSSKNKFYINLGSGVIINIPNKNLNGAKENDLVFVSLKKGEKHIKQQIGTVVRIVETSTIQDIQSFNKAVVKKDYTRNYYYIRINDNVIYIPDKELNKAYPGDLVTVQITDNKMAKVVDIIKRNNNEHVFEYKEINGEKKFTPIGTTHFDIDLKTNETFEIGDRILVDLDLDNKATFVRRMDNSEGLNSYIKALFCDSGFNYEFSEKSKKEVENITGIISKEEKLRRVDLRELETFTIDGNRAKDLDDAISLEFKDNKYYLYVHIADVTHYVKYGSALFKDAYLKSTSVYPANTVFAMLPKELSNGVCSLNPNEDKLTKTCRIEFDLEGNVLDFQVFNSIINSNKRMTYGKVNDILTKNIVDEEYIPYENTLKMMNTLSNLLQQKKIDRGFIFFDSVSKEFEFDKHGEIESISDYHRGPAEYLIENFMLITNELVTSLAYYYQLPFAFRNHEGPTIDQISKLRSNLKEYKKFVNTIRNITNPKMLQKILLNLCKDKETSEATYFSKIVLRCMNRAFYESNNRGHYALALDYYGTFTSPIRRFPDLLNHLMIEKIITGDMEDLEKYREEYKNMCVHCNEMQIASEKFELHIEDMLMRKYISKFIGQELDAKIEFISHHVIGIKTTNNICGYIELPKNSFDGHKVIINETIYEVGDKIKVTLDGMKPNSDEILFTIKEKVKVLSKRKKV